MKTEQYDDFVLTLTDVFEAYGKLSTPGQMAFYWNALKHYELEDIRRAFGQHALNPENGQFMPMPAHLAKFIDGSSQSRAGTAWLKVDRAMRSVGGGDSVVFDDPLIHATLAQLGDWPKLCQTPENELHFLQNKFEKHYQALVINPPQAWPRVLIGRYQAENALAGYNQDKPITIGNIEQCHLVYKGGVNSSELVQIGNTNPVKQLAQQKQLGSAA